MGVSSPCAKRARTDERGTSLSAVAGLPVLVHIPVPTRTPFDESNGIDGLAIALAHPHLPMTRPRHLQLQSSCATTLQDSESEDSLLAMAARSPTPPSPSSFDSQLTANLIPNVRGREEDDDEEEGEEEEEVTEGVQPVAHWSDTDTFWRSV